MRNARIFHSPAIGVDCQEIKTRQGLINYLNSNLPLKRAEYKRGSKTAYEIYPAEINRGVFLFQGTYNANWRLQSLRPGFIIDGYANGYWLPALGSPQREKIDLRFIPERCYQGLILISAILLSLIAALALFLLRFERREKRKN